MSDDVKQSESCGGCRFGMVNPQDLKMIFCRRFPPQTTISTTRPGMIDVNFPVLSGAKGWCGEYKTRILTN